MQCGFTAALLLVIEIEMIADPKTWQESALDR